MGPNVIFDKSFLQSLNIDESVWFNHFFLGNICPLFYIETLADLDKKNNINRPADRVVGEIASKFPEGGTPNVFHLDLCIGDLLGQIVPMTGQIPVSAGRPVKHNNKGGFVLELSPEAEAFSRWQNGEFRLVEKKIASHWRRLMESLVLENRYKLLSDTDIDYEQYKSLEAIQIAASAFFNAKLNREKQIAFVFSILNIPFSRKSEILSRWSTSVNQSLSEFAPYVSYVMTIELFFIIAMRKGIISSHRNSNMVDILYLYYLPFCNVFVSSDKLHRRCASLFLREDQEFVWGQDLKEDLRKIDEYYKLLPDDVKDKGIDFFALDPPNDDNFLVTRLWKKHLNWNGPRPVHRHDAEADSNMIKETNDFASASTLCDNDIDFDISNPDAILIKRQMSKKKGSWYQLPRDIQ